MDVRGMGMGTWGLGIGLVAGIVMAAPGTWGQGKQAPTAREVVAAIKEHVGVPWRPETVDTFKAGNPDTPVTGIAVTMMATMDVLEKASAKGLNFVITHEPTFYAHLDKPEGLPESDPVWAEKRAFIEKHGMVVWRFHDHWHMRKPDGIEAGTVHALGWEKFQNAENQYLFVLPETTVKQLAEEVAKKLGSPVVRVVGNAEMKVTRVGLSPGAAGFEEETHALESDAVEVLLVGETREWETVEYAADAETQGRRKALIVIGHVPSEQAGMEECARWLTTFVSGVPVEFVATKEPFWPVPVTLEKEAPVKSSLPIPAGEASLRVNLRMRDDAAFIGESDVRLVAGDGKEVRGKPGGMPGETLFFGLAPGKYTVQASAPGYEAAEVSSEIEAGPRERTLYVVMEPRQLPLREVGKLEAPARGSGAPSNRNSPLDAFKAGDAWKQDFPLLNEWETFPPTVDPRVGCPTEKVLNGVGERMKEFVSNLEKFTATEEVLHYAVDPGKKQPPPEKRQFEYLVTVSQNRIGTFLLDEDRDGTVDPGIFPGHVATMGLPALDLIFHPVMAGDFEFVCEGLGRAGGKAAWQVHFVQRADQPVRIRAYRLNGVTYQVHLKGRAWIDPGSFQLIRMETELEAPIPEILLVEEQIAIEYAPVRFKTQNIEIWLPHEAELHVVRKTHVYYRRHTFTNFKLFNVETAQNIQAPKGSYSFVNSSDYEIQGVLTVTTGKGAKQETVSVEVVVPAKGRVFKLVGPGKDVNLPVAEVASATFVHDGKAEWMTVQANLVKETTVDVIPETAMTKKP